LSEPTQKYQYRNGPKDCKSNLTDYYEEYHFIIVNLILLIEGS
jgi:hypothetical protein